MKRAQRMGLGEQREAGFNRASTGRPGSLTAQSSIRVLQIAFKDERGLILFRPEREAGGHSSTSR